MANGKLKEAKGSIVFIDNDNSYMFELASSARFINAAEYMVSGPDMLLGFLSGIAAQDFDLECIFIDKFRKFVPQNMDTLRSFFENLAVFSEKRSTDIVISISEAVENLPAFLQPYLISAGE